MPQRRKKYTDENRSTRDLILDIAEQEIASNGVDGLRLKDIASQVGIQLPSLYAHFAGRKELLQALAERMITDVEKIYSSLHGLPPREALLASADRTIDFFVERPGFARLLMSDFQAPRAFSIFNQSSDKIEKVLQAIDDIIKKGVAENTVRDVPPDLFLAFRMGVTLFPLFMRKRTNNDEMMSDPEAIERIKRESHRLLAQFISVS